MAEPTSGATAQARDVDAIELKREDLPLSCPTPETDVWNLHPKVYLPIEKTGSATCPYCGARYVLVDE